MNSRFQWLIAALAVVLAAIVGIYAYNVGVAHGLAESARLGAAGAAGAPVAWGPRPWGFGFFPFFPVFPLFFFLLIWFAAFRGFGRRGRWAGPGCGYYRGTPAEFEEWHRRAHAEPPAPPASGERRQA